MVIAYHRVSRKLVSRCFHSTYPFDVPDVPDVQTVVVVHTGQLVVSLVIRQRDRVRVARVVWLAEHVTGIKKKYYLSLIRPD